VLSSSHDALSLKALEVEKRERELRKKIAALKAPLLGRRRELKKEDRSVSALFSRLSALKPA
jgi:hypothetical protein